MASGDTSPEVPPAEELTEEECWRMLGENSVGHLALSVRALPVIVPVHYHLSGRAIDICADHLGLHGALVRDTVAAFSVDAFDQASASGWVVHVQGRVSSETGISVQRCPCPCGRSGRFVRLEAGTVAGRYLQLRGVRAVGA